MTIFTIGHSNLSPEAFLANVKRHEIELVIDVRSTPASQRYPHFNHEVLERDLLAATVGYRRMGACLGGRPARSELIRDGVADYVAMAATAEFRAGIDQVVAQGNSVRTALMCSEHNPAECHRCLLVGRYLSERGEAVVHVLKDQSVTTQQDVECELLRRFKLAEEDMFVSRSERVGLAYELQSVRHAFRSI